MVGGVGFSLTMYLQCTAVIVHGLYIKFECFWTDNGWVFHDDTLSTSAPNIW